MDKIICIGKNYLDHAQELGDVIPAKPVLFLKPPSAVLQGASSKLQAQLPKNKGEVHHECEIAVRINSNHKITHVTLGLDMTLRKLQGELKKQGHPWEVSKVFKDSVILGPWIPIFQFPDYLKIPFSLSIDGQLRQKSQGTEMRLTPQECLTYASEFFPLCEGDVIMTGTPKGVGPVSLNQTALLEWGHLSFEVCWE